MASVVATAEIGVVITSSPLPTLSAISEICIASNPLATPIQYLTPRYLANLSSKAETSCDNTYVPESNTLFIAS